MNRQANNDPARQRSAPAIRLSITLMLGGSLHFLAPRFFDGIIPGRLPGSPRAYTYASGAAALGIGIGLLIARTRRLAATLASAFFIAVMPAKMKLAVFWCRDDTKRRPTKVIAIVQVFWQVPLIAEAWRARRDAADPHEIEGPREVGHYRDQAAVEPVRSWAMPRRSRCCRRHTR